VAFEEKIEKFTPPGEGVAPNGWGVPDSTGNGTGSTDLTEIGLAIVSSAMGPSVFQCHGGARNVSIAANRLTLRGKSFNWNNSQ
jgi:hypothetical protein